jgi:hypothetical protein
VLNKFLPLNRHDANLWHVLSDKIVELCTAGNKASKYTSDLWNVKVKLSLCFFLTKHHTVKTYWGVEWRYSSTHSLTSALHRSEWSASRPGRFTPRERAPDTHWIGGWVGPRAVMDTLVKRKLPSLRQELNPRTLIVHSVAQRYTDWAITVL